MNASYMATQTISKYGTLSQPNIPPFQQSLTSDIDLCTADGVEFYGIDENEGLSHESPYYFLFTSHLFLRRGIDAGDLFLAQT